MLIDNIVFLKENSPILYEELKKSEENTNESKVILEDTKTSDKTLKIEKDNSMIYLHSKYNPLREAESIIDNLGERENIDEDTYVIFYGIGLGYHINVFAGRYPDVEFSIYEPSIEVFCHFLEYNNLKSNSYRKLDLVQCEYNPKIMEDFFKTIIKKIDKKIIIIDLPSYSSAFKENHEIFFKRFKEVLTNERKSLHTDYAFQKRWIINSMKNLKEVLSTPNIILEKKGEFKGKTAVLVAAGPSLNDEIENIRYIKDNGLAYIFSVGSAVNTLIYNNIYPDAACTYDPAAFNQNVFKTIKDKNICNVPMIFGSSVGYETLENYPGEKYHMITSQDTVAGYFLKNETGGAISIIQDAPSIAVVTLQLLYTLGFDNILLVGQNLGYRGKERYSEGISYNKELTDDEISNGLWVKDVYGNEILTNEGFNSMRHQMEIYIKILPNINVINTTKGGAQIEGTEFKELKDVIETVLDKKTVDKNWLNGNKTSYDKEYMEFQAKSMDKSYEKALKINKEYKLILTKIEKAINNRNYTQTENLYIKLDKELRRIENNDFYKTFILPMNRVQYKVLANSIDSLNEEKNPYEKGKRIVNSFRGFIGICTADIEMIKPIYDEMKKYINEF
ncbi:motility associated factor glycosyltransferase family protein [Paratissierella segnis]|jgi:hypothetical protein|uniref:Motility associated factor glycosyltransferase family protein n=1 Tax=Paratissierella segnis TaxID=2763679 RepID=A0A926ET01_9FIRM|nr:6-hydroxymethylpterin diphosphokinase MptE-like protein [Paratissierella segnis]MBC8588311.1 motility associated factor glycosyltransferase family protein [Paratissierella segnis]